MEELPLDAFANIYLDAIKYREESGNLRVQLGENDIEAAKFMRERLMNYLLAKHSISPETHDVSLDTKGRKLLAAKRPVAEVEEPSLDDLLDQIS